MNNKILVATVVVIVIAGGILLLRKGGSYKNPANSNSPIQQQSTTITSPAQTQTSTGSAKENVATVTLTSSGFEPATITVKTGTKVVWTNKSGEAATVNSAVHPTHLVYPPLNLGEFNDGGTLSLMFDKPGTYNYHNHLNPSETGTVVVRQ